MIYLSPVEIYNLWSKMNFNEVFVYEVFGLMNGLNEIEAWNHFLLFVISMLKNI